MAPRARAVLPWIVSVVVTLVAAGLGSASPQPPYMGEVRDLRPAVAASGGAVAAWAHALEQPGRYSVRTADRGPSGWAPPRTLTPPTESISSVDLAGNPAGDAVVVWQRDPAQGGSIRAASRTAAGAWDEPVDLASEGALASAPRVGVGADGTAVAVWGLFDGTLAAAVRAPGGAWGPMRIVSGPPAPDLAWSAPAVAPDGSALVTWVSGPEEQRTVLAAELPAGSEVIGAPQPLSSPADVPWSPSAALGPAGEAVVAWREIGPDRYTGPILVATRPAGGPWAAPVALAVPEAVANVPTTATPSRASRRAPDAVVDATGRAIVVWADPIGEFSPRQEIVRAAVRGAVGAWTVQGLAEPGEIGQPALAAGAGGTVVASWRDGVRLIGSAATPDAAFALPENLSPSDDAVAGDVRIGVDGTGALVAVWRSRSDGLAVVRSATRPAGQPWSPAQDISRVVVPPQPDPGHGVTPPVVEPRPTGEQPRPRGAPRRTDRVEFSVRQLRINQRIAQAALRRVRALEARLAGRPVPRRLQGRAGVVRLTRAQLVVNQRISQAALRRVAVLEARLAGRRPPARRPRSERGRIALTARQLLIDQRIAQAALRRVDALEDGLDA